MILDKKQIWTVFFEFKWLVKQWRQLAKSAMLLAQALLMNIQCNDVSKSFAKEKKILKLRSIVAGHQKLTMNNWKQSLKLIFLQLHENFLKNSTSTILGSFAVWIKLKR